MLNIMICLVSNMPSFHNIVQEIAYTRLEKKKELIKEKFPWVLGLKLSGSIGDGYIFVFMFKDVTIASDYDIFILVEGYPKEEEVDELIEIIMKPEYPENPIESILLQNIDIKMYTTALSYQGPGKRLPSISDRTLPIIRHLQGGMVIFGEEYLQRYSKLSEKDKRRIYLRVKDREKIFNIYTDLGALLREAKALDNEEMERKIIEILKKFGNYHVLSFDDLQELTVIKQKLEEELSKSTNF